mmetsp:Transcript_23656/g.45044  ORF Transcript_23656/g.45044 Transcript_23656/m.45044 type:complete len:431 (+) Transcript_23656:81-1373(+)|eukprot:CAMPEP_0114244832 /NCGR_PEP_ID=MMETSP0058-20121206/11556_1 /TAXON_ID=36894 /ORGANISM="Pyramimonas parkeae, CCMP726" /LENGTH=430 /DNA_ID=CAMNT_0001357811 /DNA_START=78 /DNA_END=1370 /DNA_ORIENTATION=+
MAAYTSLAASTVVSTGASFLNAKRAHSRQPARRLVVASYQDGAGKKATLAAGAALASPLVSSPARAVTASELAAELQDKLNAAAGVVEEVSKNAKVAGDVAKGAVDLAKPYVEKATPVVKKAAEEVVKTATPVLREGADSAGKAVSTTLKSSGIDVDAALSATKSATSSLLDSTNPTLTTSLKALAAQVPDGLVATALAATTLALLSPIWRPLLTLALRGYAGDMTAASALGLLNAKDSLMVDLRSVQDRAAKGTPMAPRGATSRIVQVPMQTVQDGAVRSRLSGAGDVESLSTAYVIANLKKATKETSIMLLGRTGDDAKEVACCLDDLGFKKTFVVSGGYNGRDGWLQSNLAITAGSGVQQSGSVKILGQIIGGSQKVDGSAKKLGGGSQRTPPTRATPSGSQRTPPTRATPSGSQRKVSGGSQKSRA